MTEIYKKEKHDLYASSSRVPINKRQIEGGKRNINRC